MQTCAIETLSIRHLSAPKGSNRRSRARHTALVRWAPGTYFQAHGDFAGKEILVLEGVFEDEFGRHPAGTWIRSPHGSRHQPFSREGALIWVKVGHLPVPDRPSVC